MFKKIYFFNAQGEDGSNHSGIVHAKSAGIAWAMMMDVIGHVSPNVKVFERVK